MVFNATFNNFSAIYRGGQFYWWRKPEDPEKTDNSEIIYLKMILGRYCVAFILHEL
jgi:hypothetical protein